MFGSDKIEVHKTLVVITCKHCGFEFGRYEVTLETKNGINLDRKVKYYYNKIYPLFHEYEDKERMV